MHVLACVIPAILAAAVVTAAEAYSFASINLTYANGTDYSAPLTVSVLILPSDPTLLVVASYTGLIRLLRIWYASPRRYVVTAVEDTVTAAPNRFVLDVKADPFRPTNLFVVTAVHDYINKGLGANGWQNGQIEILRLDGPAAKLSFDSEPLVSGLPVAQGALGGGVFAVSADLHDGRLLISQGAHTNGGVPLGPRRDTIVSGAMLMADVRTPQKTRKLTWSSNDTFTATLTTPPSVSGIEVYAVGFRSLFRPIVTARDQIYGIDAGGSPELGNRSLSCTTEEPFYADDPDRLIHIRRGRWYGMANRVRGRTDPRQCVYIWGDEENIAQLRARYPSFSPPILTTRAARANGILGSGSEGLTQYRADWFPRLRGSFFVGEFDLTQARPGLPLPILFQVDVRSRRVRKVADTPGVSLEVDPFGAVMVGQFNIGKVGIAVPVVSTAMKAQTRIRNVWPLRGKPRSRVYIVGTSLPAGAPVFLGGRPCDDVKRWTKFGYLDVISCLVPRGGPYLKNAVSVKVGSIELKEAYTVLAPRFDLVV